MGCRIRGSPYYPMQELFFALLRQELDGVPLSEKAVASLSDAQTQRRLYLFAKNHDLAHMIGAALEKSELLSDEKSQKAFSEVRIKALYRYTRLWHAYGQITALFEEKKMPFIPLKGALLRHLYPVPEMRTSADIDLLVPENRLNEAVSLLEEALHFTKRGTTYHDVNLVLGDAVNLELHYNITEDDEALDRMLLRAWEFAAPLDVGKSEHRFSPDYFAYHIISHMCSHFIRGGCGVKPFIDLWLLKKNNLFDIQKTRALCENSQIHIFFDAVLNLLEVWFEGKEHTETTRAMQDFVFGGGAYGTKDNRTAVGTAKKNSGRFKYAFSRLFMPRKQLSRLYPILKKHPWLLPVCQVRRWFRTLLRGRGKTAMRELSGAATMPKAKKEAIHALLADLGL